MNSKIIAPLLLFVGCPAAVIVGLFLLSDYSYRPGGMGETSTDLRSLDLPRLDLFEDSLASANRVANNESRLFLFYHPHCPCTDAAIRNLNRLSTRFQASVRIVAFAYCPHNEPNTWIQSSLTHAIGQLPNAEVVADRNAAFCRKFGAKTSGHAMLYDKNGQLQFSGGITPGRGHEGDSRATAALLKRINGQESDASHWPVFGCPIFLAEDCIE